jgi:cytochrome c-type biogenesis protein
MPDADPAERRRLLRVLFVREYRMSAKAAGGELQGPRRRSWHPGAGRSSTGGMTDADSVGIGLAFAAGLVSFLSPCVVPLVPSYLGFVSGLTLDELTSAGAPHRTHTMVRATLFVLGFSLVFVSLGAVATTFGLVIARALPWLQRVGGVLIVLFGAHLLGVFRLAPLMRERRIHLAGGPMGHAGAVVAGIAFGAAWTPCVGPVLATILMYAGTSGTVARGTGLLAVYAVGLGLPFLLLALFTDRLLGRVRRASRWSRPLELLTGAVLVVVGLALVTGRFQAFTAMLAGFGQLITLHG